MRFKILNLVIKRSKHEIATVLQLYEADFLKQYKTSSQVLRTFNAIKICRTSALGGHKRKCGDCNHEQISYNSCRNRHCPKCQTAAKERWINEREAELLSVPYYHICIEPVERLSLLYHMN